MINHIASIEISCPVEQVYAFMTDPKNRTRYDSDLIAVRHSPEGPLHIGTQIVEVRGAMGVTRDMVTEVSAMEPNQRIGYRTLQGDPINAYGTYEFVSVPGGTRLILNFTMDPKGLVKLATPFIAPGLKRDIAKGLSNIKRVLENQSVHVQ